MKQHLLSIIGMFISVLMIIGMGLIVSNAGFPDSYLSPYDRFYHQRLFPIFLSAHCLFLALFVLSFVFKYSVKFLLILYVVIVIAMLSSDYYFYSIMDHGQGG